jgi:DNA-binding NarL/FixJ family response regulator
MPFELAWTLLVQGQVRRRQRQRRAARTSLDRARALFEQMGAPLWAARAADELARIPSGRSEGSLTPAQRRVATLAASGKSNKQIAAELFLSVHTIELHLSHAYAKLGVHSRSQLAGRLGAPAQVPNELSEQRAG